MMQILYYYPYHIRLHREELRKVKSKKDLAPKNQFAVEGRYTGKIIKKEIYLPLRKVYSVL